uniref:Glutathione S-transferase n=1 Tax=Timema bartmani TaxID=61472 RepID=A0A7R9F7M6_9NEOP|nr:unnamed protein product [Timema bartmani]
MQSLHCFWVEARIELGETVVSVVQRGYYSPIILRTTGYNNELPRVIPPMTVFVSFIRAFLAHLCFRELEVQDDYRPVLPTGQCALQVYPAITVTVFVLLNRCKMTIDLYYQPHSAPCRSIMLLAKAIGVELNLKKTSILDGEHLKPEFLKMNPQHCIPTLDDNGFILWESRAILAYLQSQYGKHESLYPKDPKKRAVVDQRLYFDMGTLYSQYCSILCERVDFIWLFFQYPTIFQKIPGSPKDLKKLEEAFTFLENFLTFSAWVAGDRITIADYAVITSVSTAEVGTL